MSPNKQVLDEEMMEKEAAVQLEEAMTDKHREAVIVDDLNPEFTEQEWKKIKSRIDRRLVVTLGVLYIISTMDRSNVGVASIAGLTTDLELDVGFRYSIVALTFFATYCVFQAPGTLLCRFIGPRYFLAGTTFGFGILMVRVSKTFKSTSGHTQVLTDSKIGFGFPNDWKVLVGLRVILGVLEAGFLPGMCSSMSEENAMLISQS
jgi:uncharacterized membrane protein YgcG